MAHLTFLTFCLAILFALNSAFSWGDSDATLETSGNDNIQSQDNINTENMDQIDATIEDSNNLLGYIQTIPGYSSYNSYVPYFQPRIATPSTRITITYKLGKRINGDRLVSSTTQNQQWTLPQNVTQSLIYPKNGVGAVITYVEIVVDQSTNLGRGFVTTGGVGQRQISIIIEAQKTLHFRQTIQIYGY